ncbi:hypothetical protein [Ventosimonas gracilis]|uniref:hypothetical protein n=1 Tax=Ventosimonas gracilis TaxID=1680762 RepID=UPI00128EA268|nr:hypothetical protein [Ventosimonas gracilis]
MSLSPKRFLLKAIGQENTIVRSSMEAVCCLQIVRPPMFFCTALAALGLLASPAGLADFIADKTITFSTTNLYGS